MAAPVSDGIEFQRRIGPVAEERNCSMVRRCAKTADVWKFCILAGMLTRLFMFLSL